MMNFTPGQLGFTPVWCVGGPLDGRGYSDMPLFPNGLPAERVRIPIGDTGETATYLRRAQPSSDGRWRYDVAIDGIHPFPTGTQVRAGGSWNPPAPTPPPWIETARVLAEEAHAGQVDKSGAPYVEHPARVASRFDPVDEPVAHAAAWLHDVLEDTEMDADWLRLHGIPDDVIRVVELLTRTPEVSAETYYAAIRLDPVATMVKAADIADNLLPERTRLLEPATRARLRVKYDRALRALGLDTDTPDTDLQENA